MAVAKLTLARINAANVRGAGVSPSFGFYPPQTISPSSASASGRWAEMTQTNNNNNKTLK
jgi:hypothetical protein